MSGALGKLNVLLSAETAQFNSAMDKAAHRAGINMGNIRKHVRQMAPIVTAALAATATAFTVRMKQIVDDADELSKMSRKIGVSVQALSAYRHAAQLAGTDFDVLAKGIARLSRNASDAANGLATPQRAFDFLGISAVNANGTLRDTEELLLDIADKFSKMADGTKKAALAQELFGRSGVELIPFLNEGREGLEAVRKEAEKLGIVFTVEMAQQAEQFNDNMTRLKKTLDGVFITVGNSLVPGLVAMSDVFVENAVSAKEAGKSTADFGSAIIELYGVVRKTLDPMLALITYNERFVNGLGKFMTFDYKGALDEFKKIGDIGERFKNTSNELERMRNRLDELRNSTDEYKSTQKDINNIYEEAANEASEFNKMLDEGRKLAESLRTPVEVLADEQEKLNALIRAGAIDRETYNRAADQSMNKFHKNMEGQAETAEKNNDIIKELGFTFASSFEEAIVSGSKFGDVLKGLEQDLIRIAARKAIVEPVINSIFGDYGVFSSFFSKSAKGNVFSSGSLVPFATGGIIGAPVKFPMAGGRTGLAGEAGPEAILPLMRTKGGDLGVRADVGSKTVVNVYAPAGSNVSEERQQDGNMERINIYIDEAVAGNIRPGTKTFRALKSNFSLGQTLIKR